MCRCNLIPEWKSHIKLPQSGIKLGEESYTADKPLLDNYIGIFYIEQDSTAIGAIGRQNRSHKPTFYWIPSSIGSPLAMHLVFS